MDKLIMYLQVVLLFIISCDSLNTPTSANFQMENLPYKILLSSFETDQQIEDYETIVLQSQDEAETFLKEYAPLVSEDHKLMTVQYSDSIAAGAFTGERPNTSYSMEVDSISVEDQTVHVHITETGSSVGSRAVVWPAQFIVLSKDDISQKEIQFKINRVCDVSPCAWER